MLPHTLATSIHLNTSPYKFKIQLPFQIFTTNTILCSIYIYGLLNYSLTTIVIVETHNRDWKMLYFALFWVGKTLGGCLFLAWRILGSCLCGARRIVTRRTGRMHQNSVNYYGENNAQQLMHSSSALNENSFLLVRKAKSSNNLAAQQQQQQQQQQHNGSSNSSSPSSQQPSSASSERSEYDISTESSWNPLKNVNMQRIIAICFFLLVAIISNIAFIFLRNILPDDVENISDGIVEGGMNDITWWIMIVCRALLGLSHGVIITLVREHFARMGGEVQSGVLRGREVTSSGIDYSQWRLGFLVVLSIMEFLAFSITPALGLLQEYVGKRILPNIFCPAQDILSDECTYSFLSTFTIMTALLIAVGIILLFCTCFLQTIYHKSTSVKKIMDPQYYRIGGIKFRKHRLIRSVIVCSWILVTFTLTYCCIVFNSLDIFLPWDISQLEATGISLMLGIPVGTIVSCCIVVGSMFLLMHMTKRHQRNTAQRQLHQPFSPVLSMESPANMEPAQSDNITKSKVLLKYKAYAMFFMCLLLAGYGFATSSLFVDTIRVKTVIQCLFGVLTSALLPMTLALVWHSFYSTLENLFMRPSRLFMPFYTTVEALFALITVAIIVHNSHESPSVIFIFGFVTLVLGLFCMSLITLLSVNNVVGVIVMHHSNRDVKFNDNAIMAVKQVRNKRTLFSLIDGRFLVSLDHRNRITIRMGNRNQVEEASYFHRCFQHKNLLRLKGHWMNTQKREYYLMFDELNTEAYELLTLNQFYDQKWRAQYHAMSHFRWNQKIDIAIKMVTVIAELHEQFCCHGHLSSWNVLLFLSKQSLASDPIPIRKVKLVYLGQDEGTQLPHAPWKKRDISSITDINDVGLLLLELFEEKLSHESSFRNLLADDRSCDIPYSSIADCAPDVAEFTQSYRMVQWRVIQSLMKECWKPVPKISCRNIIKRLKKAQLQTNFESGILLEEEEEEVMH